MATSAHGAHHVESTSATGTLLLIWQHPASRRFHRVGRLSRTDGGGYEFEYLPEAFETGFEPLLQFPHKDRPNKFESLPPFFRNRVLSAERENYTEYLCWLGLEPNAENLPMEFLARTGGSRATDTFHVVQEPPIDDGLYSRFFVSGVRHADPNGTIVQALHREAELSLREDEAYDRAPRAIKIVTADGSDLGYVPDWLVEEIHRLWVKGKKLVVKLEQINRDAPPHLCLLCRIEIAGA